MSKVSKVTEVQEESEEEEETLVPVTGLPQITVVLESAEREVRGFSFWKILSTGWAVRHYQHNYEGRYGDYQVDDNDQF